MWALLFMFAMCAVSRAQAKGEIVVKSPSDISVTVFVSGDGGLAYKIGWPDEPVLDASRLGIIVNGIDLGNGVKLGVPTRGKIDETFPVLGVHSIGRHRCGTASIPVTHIKSKTAYRVEFRACEDGAAYRYVVPGKGTRIVTGELSSWRFPEKTTFWYQTNTKYYEGFHEHREKVPPGTQIGPPMTVVYPSGRYAAVSEAAASAKYSGMTLNATGNNVFRAAFLDDYSGWEMVGDIVTPWRVTLISKDLNGLVNSDLILALNPPPSKELANAAWIRPGRSLWSYLNAERVVTPENQRKYVDAAAELGFEYVLVDAGWEDPPDKGGWGTDGKSAMDAMGELVQYAKARNIGIWVWTYYSRLLDPAARAKYFDDLSGIGVVGDKIDFMESESVAMLGFYEGCLRDAAKRRLMIDFHGANKPTGESRTWPNEMTREGVLGLEYRELPVYYTTALPFTRFLAGHADFTPMHFNSYWMSNTTRGYQLASGLILDSAVTFFGGWPWDYLRSPARDLIKAMPTVWDETIVLAPSEIGKTSAFARRAGNTWFIAIMNGDTARDVEIKTDFLTDGNYRMESYSDPLIKKTTGAIRKNDIIHVRLRPSGGYVAKIEKMD